MTTFTKTEPPPPSTSNTPPAPPTHIHTLITHFPTWFQCLFTISLVKPQTLYLTWFDSWQPHKTHLQLAFPSSTTQTPSLRHSTPLQASGMVGGLDGVTGSDVMGWAVVGLVGVGVGWDSVRCETSNQKHSFWRKGLNVYFDRLVGNIYTVCSVDLMHNEWITISLLLCVCFFFYPPWWGERWRLHPWWSPCSWLWGGWGTVLYRSQALDDRSYSRGWLHGQPCVDHPKIIPRSLCKRWLKGLQECFDNKMMQWHVKSIRCGMYGSDCYVELLHWCLVCAFLLGYDLQNAPHLHVFQKIKSDDYIHQMVLIRLKTYRKFSYKKYHNTQITMLEWHRNIPL